MPVHDWTRVNAGTFHHFHTAWITQLSDRLNGGILPQGYYALTEQHSGRVMADILTLHAEASEPGPPREDGPVAIAEAPPRVGRKVVAAPNAAYRATRRTLTIRHISGHRVVALLEIVSPANKDRPSSVEDFVEKVHAALKHGCHILVVDLHRPGPHDRTGIHGAIWEPFDPADYALPEDKTLTLASYVGGTLPEAYIVHVAVGDVLPEMPLFLRPNFHVDVPLEAAYLAAYHGVPTYWRDIIEGR